MPRKSGRNRQSVYFNNKRNPQGNMPTCLFSGRELNIFLFVCQLMLQIHMLPEQVLFVVWTCHWKNNSKESTTLFVAPFEVCFLCIREEKMWIWGMCVCVGGRFTIASLAWQVYFKMLQLSQTPTDCHAFRCSCTVTLWCGVCKLLSRLAAWSEKFCGIKMQAFIPNSPIPLLSFKLRKLIPPCIYS